MKNIIRYPILSENDKKLPVYVTSVGCNAHQFKIYRKKGQSQYQLMLCKAGTGMAIIDGKEIEIKYGDVLFIEKNKKHFYKNITDLWITDWITYDGDSVPYISKLTTGVHRFKNFDEIATILEAIAATRYGIKWAENTSVLLYRLLLLCDTTASVETTSAIQRLKPAITFIEDNCHVNITLEEIAESLGVSREHACTLFQSAFGMRPFEYVTKNRLQKAKELLSSRHDLPLGEIAEMCGFNSAAYFTLKFKQYENTTPSKFRQEN